MTPYTGWQYLLIDAASAFGLDKETFEVRIKWTEDMLKTPTMLEDSAHLADNKALFTKAVQAIRKAQAGIPTGHLVGLDAVCSGMQIMSAITGCEAGAKATGLIDSGKRPDAYTDVTDAMNIALPGMDNITRTDAKRATMTSLYGSKAVPKELFGDDTPELDAFYKAMTTVAPGAWGLLHNLMGSWQPYTLAHAWKLPDGFDARVKVMQKIETRIEVDELDHSSFTYEYYDNVGTEKGISLAANVVHSIDGYVLRSVHRRCNYDQAMLNESSVVLDAELLERKIIHTPEPVTPGTKVAYYIQLWEETGMVDAVILPHLDQNNVQQLPDAMLDRLIQLVDRMLSYKPFPVVAIHDEFKCGPNHMNHLRKVYSDILAELAESKILDFIMSTIHGKPCIYDKASTTLGKKIRESSYALC